MAGNAKPAGVAGLIADRLQDRKLPAVRTNPQTPTAVPRLQKMRWPHRVAVANDLAGPTVIFKAQQSVIKEPVRRRHVAKLFGP